MRNDTVATNDQRVATPSTHVHQDDRTRFRRHREAPRRAGPEEILETSKLPRSLDQPVPLAGQNHVPIDRTVGVRIGVNRSHHHILSEASEEYARTSLWPVIRRDAAAELLTQDSRRAG
jgi:hypothetical protein